MARDTLYTIKAAPMKDIFNGDHWPDVQESYLSRHAYRDEAVATQPIRSGSYITPTSYRTFRYRCDVSDPHYEAYIDDAGLGGPCGTLYYQGSQYYIGGAPRDIIGYFGVDVRSKWDVLPVIPGYLESRCIAAVHEEIQQGGWEISQTFGELPETINLLVSASKRLLSAVKAAKNGNFALAARNLAYDPKHARKPFGGNVANGTIEYQYGWKPLMSDIYNLANTIQNGFEHPVSKEITVKKTENFTFSDRDTIRNKEIVTHSGGGVYVAKAGIVITVNNETLTSLGAHGLTDPLALAWELVPLSFVIDWFIPVGNFIGNIMPHVGLDYSLGYLTKYVKWDASVAHTTVEPTIRCPNGRLYHVIAGHSGFRDEFRGTHSEGLECFQRQIMPFPPPPVPYLDLKLNLSKIGSLLSLLAALMAK